MARKERILWSNINLNVEDFKDYFEEEFPDEELSDDRKYELMHDLNNDYLDDERMNLDVQLNNSIIAIAGIGRWNGRVSGYKIIESGNIRDIFYSDCDYVKWYSDGYNIKAIMHHHDGTNYVEYREIREGVNIDNLTDKLYNQEDVSRDYINRYTRSILPEVKKVYGW